MGYDEKLRDLERRVASGDHEAMRDLVSALDEADELDAWVAGRALDLERSSQAKDWRLEVPWSEADLTLDRRPRDTMLSRGWAAAVEVAASPVPGFQRGPIAAPPIPGAGRPTSVYMAATFHVKDIPEREFLREVASTQDVLVAKAKARLRSVVEDVFKAGLLEEFARDVELEVERGLAMLKDIGFGEAQRRGVRVTDKLETIPTLHEVQSWLEWAEDWFSGKRGVRRNGDAFLRELRRQALAGGPDEERAYAEALDEAGLLDARRDELAKAMLAAFRARDGRTIKVTWLTYDNHGDSRTIRLSRPSRVVVLPESQQEVSNFDGSSVSDAAYLDGTWSVDAYDTADPGFGDVDVEGYSGEFWVQTPRFWVSGKVTPPHARQWDPDEEPGSPVQGFSPNPGPDERLRELEREAKSGFDVDAWRAWLEAKVEAGIATVGEAFLVHEDTPPGALEAFVTGKRWGGEAGYCPVETVYPFYHERRGFGVRGSVWWLAWYWPVYKVEDGRVWRSYETEVGNSTVSKDQLGRQDAWVDVTASHKLHWMLDEEQRAESRREYLAYVLRTGWDPLGEIDPRGPGTLAEVAERLLGPEYRANPRRPR